MLLNPNATYRDNYDRFTWAVPEFYNIARDVCDRHADGANGTALIHEQADGTAARYSYRDIQRMANRMANVFLANGAKRGDVVMILLGQDPIAAAAHVACWKAGLISLPTSVLFGAEALAYRLNDSGAIFALTDRSNLEKLNEARQQAGELRQIFVTDGEGAGGVSLSGVMQMASDRFDTVVTRAEDPAFINYSSGTTGWPKGVLHAHRAMIGHIPGAELLFDFYPDAGDTVWSPADWSWLAGLMDILMPFWFYGATVVASRARKFDPEHAFHLMVRHSVSTTLLTPTTLRMMRQVPLEGIRDRLKLRVIVSGGESVGAELADWTARELKTQLNEVFGQTECNLVLGHNAGLITPRPGSLGMPVPGHQVAIIDDQGIVVPNGDVGHLAVRRPDPVMFLEYWRKPEATREKFIGEWMITGDLGSRDDDGYFWFKGRADDVITSSGYRIGPGEIEDVIARHDSVAMAAVIGVPDEERTERIKAFVVLRPGARESSELAEAIRAFVAERLARHECPREIAFVSSLPMTTNGKIIRRELRERETAARDR